MSEGILAASTVAMRRFSVDQPAEFAQVSPATGGAVFEAEGSLAKVPSAAEKIVERVVQAAENVSAKKQTLVKLLIDGHGRGASGAMAIEAARSDSTLAVQRLTSVLLTAPLLPPLSEAAEAGSFASAMSGHKKKFDEAMARVPYSSLAQFAPARSTDHDFLAGISGAIGDLEKNYLKVYEDAVAKNKAFYEDFSNIYSDLSTYFDPKDTGTHLLLRVGASIKDENGNIDKTLPGLLDKLEALETKYNGLAKLSGATIGGVVVVGANPDDVSDGVLVVADTKAKAEKWAKEMGVPVEMIQGEKRSWRVMVDISPVREMIQALKKHQTPGVAYSPALAPAVFNAWKVGLESQEAKLKNNTSALASKLSNANSVFESIVKILSSTYSAFLDMWKGYLN